MSSNRDAAAVPDIPGADTIVEWFGRWPSFHDGEVLELHIARGQGSSHVHVYAFNVSDRVNAAGSYIREREAVVIFEFADIRWLRIEGEDADHQNVLSLLQVEQVEDGYRLLLDPCYGLYGEIVAAQLSVRLDQVRR